LRDALMQGRDYVHLHAVARQEGFKDMRHDGFKKAVRGLTTLEEVIEATMVDGT